METSGDGTLRFEGYDETRRIGQGGMATVLKARQISLDRWVAIKVLSPDQCTTDEEIDRFQSEARIAARMNHPGIVQVYDAFYRNDRFCFVMEYVDGYTVASWIANRGYIPQDACLFVAAGVASALAYAWERQRLVHCDIKPDNIMIDADGSVKVTDFGLSKSMFTLQARTMSEQESFVFGTPAYIAPEQAMGSESIFIQADMYALGATLYHMCTGRRLFHDLEPMAMMEAQVKQQDADPYDLNAQLSPCFCDFIERLLSKDPAGRYDSWNDVIAEIDALRQNHPLQFGALDLAAFRSTIRRSPMREAARAKLPAEAPAGKAAPQGATAQTPRGAAPVRIQATMPAPAAPSTRPGTPPAPRLAAALASRTARRLGFAAALLVAAAGAVLAIRCQQRACHRREANGAEAERIEIENHLRIKPADYTAAIARYHAVLDRLQGSGHEPLKKQIAARCEELRQSRQQHVESVLKALRDDVRLYVEDRQFAKAAEIVMAYDGPLAEETKKDRAELADRLNEQARRLRP